MYWELSSRTAAIRHRTLGRSLPAMLWLVLALSATCGVGELPEECAPATATGASSPEPEAFVCVCEALFSFEGNLTVIPLRKL